MNACDANALMNAVLDGEASPSERAALERAIAGHPELVTEQAALEALFEDLLHIPTAYPPEGLVASVMANIPQNRAWTHREDQLLAGPGVIGTSSRSTRGRRREEFEAGQIEVQPWLTRKGSDMNEQSNRFSGNRKKYWIGGGIAAAVVVVGLASGLIPPTGKDTAGTIVPAQRYQAPQSNVQDVQGGGLAGNEGQGGTIAPATDSAANASAGRAVDASAGRAVNASAGHAVDAATSRAVNASAGHAVDAATSRAVNASAGHAVDAATGRAVNASAGHAVDAATGRAVNASAGHAVDAATGRAVNASAGHAVDAATGRAVNASAGHAVDAATGRAVNASAGHAVDAATGRAVNASAGHAVDAATGRAVNASAGRAVNGMVAQ